MNRDSGTSEERFRYLKQINLRLRKFLYFAESRGWTIEPSAHTLDCIVVRHPILNDHFVLYPTGHKNTASLAVYDGRDGYEFSPVTQRRARAYISESVR